jgi:predicted ABC-type transport system involved in lysophospholipase L1 biosynthesis ATPase subunit
MLGLLNFPDTDRVLVAYPFQLSGGMCQRVCIALTGLSTGANAANVLLDLLFVGFLRLHTTGAAIATVLSQLLSAILVITALLKTDLPCRIMWFLAPVYFLYIGVRGAVRRNSRNW